MVLQRGNMWTSKADLICVTGNSTIRRDGCLVMGRGAALQCQHKFPGINRTFGGLIEMHAQEWGKDSPYGVLVHHQIAQPDLGIFQVKHHYRDNAVKLLIMYSLMCLKDLAETDYPLVAVNFPGIGWGGLRREDVLPLLGCLPDNVEVWEY